MSGVSGLTGQMGLDAAVDPNAAVDPRTRQSAGLFAHTHGDDPAEGVGPRSPRRETLQRGLGPGSPPGKGYRTGVFRKTGPRLI